MEAIMGKARQVKITYRDVCQNGPSLEEKEKEKKRKKKNEKKHTRTYALFVPIPNWNHHQKYFSLPPPPTKNKLLFFKPEPNKNHNKTKQQQISTTKTGCLFQQKYIHKNRKQLITPMRVTGAKCIQMHLSSLILSGSTFEPMGFEWATYCGHRSLFKEDSKPARTLAPDNDPSWLVGH